MTQRALTSARALVHADRHLLMEAEWLQEKLANAAQDEGAVGIGMGVMQKQDRMAPQQPPIWGRIRSNLQGGGFKDLKGFKGEGGSP